MRRRITKLALLPALLVAGLLSCKSGDPVVGIIVPAVPDFLPDTPTAPDHLVELQTGSIDGGRIVLDVLISDVDDPVAGVAIKLTYPSNFSRFTNCMEGDLFPTGACDFSETAPGSGEVFVTEGVAGGTPAPVVGTRVAVRVEFLVFGDGSGPIVFEGENIGGGETSAVVRADNEVIEVEWVAGTLIGE